MPIVVAIDPGEVTGWSSWYFDDSTPLWRDEYGLIKGGVDGFIAWAAERRALLGRSIVIVEHYVQDGGPAKGTAPQQIEGALRASLYAVAAPPPIEQTRSVKRQVSDALLKARGLWITPAEARVDPAIQHEDARDVNDTQIHALAFAKLLGHEPTIAAYWPEGEA